MNHADNGGSDDEYGRSVSKIAVAQICEDVGFEAFQNSALDAMSDVAIRFLGELGKTSAFHANCSGRTESNVFDVVRALEELGNSNLGVLGSLRKLVAYVEFTDIEVPFAQPLQDFPVVRERVMMVPSFAQIGENPNGKHIPDWLPAFPDLHTYVHTPMWNERKTDPRAEKIEQARQRRKAERSLLSLQQRLLCNGASTSNVDSINDEKDIGQNGDIGINGSNPFLVSPLQDGEKDVACVKIPDRILNVENVDSHVSVLDTFAPAIEALKDNGDFGDARKMFLPEKRPAVQLKFGTGKKLLGESLNFSIRNRGAGRQAIVLGRNDERDDKKRRAELILKLSMENPQELTQL